jgi:hypothetical protein
MADRQMISGYILTQSGIVPGLTAANTTPNPTCLGWVTMLNSLSP